MQLLSSVIHSPTDTTNVHYLCAVSTSIPEKPNALSPCMHTTGPRSDGGLFCSKRAAAIANPQPTPIVPNVPASNLFQIKDYR